MLGLKMTCDVYRCYAGYWKTLGGFVGAFYFGAKFNCSRWLVCVDNKAFSFLVESKSHCLQNDGCVFSFFSASLRFWKLWISIFAEVFGFTP